ncbi:hypothetical protein JOF41_002372 [Saccharothrix coeruleofusca]|uniref:hypothetical protein n=1 Tax=Saccharothrix coeruleofusca TaxID=33919 RepID=UPI001AE5F4E0|nr:hypothetical protein [Saccharothrix coeruleofusca]MBP2336194.1 hypothetical protein [Saccharothrix coeruleofusca]
MRNQRHTPLARFSAVLCVVVALLSGAAPAWADGGPAGQDVHVAQTLGTRELTVVVRAVEVVPGPLRVNVITHAGTPAGGIRLSAAPTGVRSGDDAAGSPSETRLDLGAEPGSYDADLAVDVVGPWELVLDDGEHTGRIPFVVPAPVVSPVQSLSQNGFLAAGVLLVLAIATAVLSRRAWVPLIPAAGVVAAIAVGVVGALLTGLAPPPPRPGVELDATVDNVRDPYAGGALAPQDFSRPPATLVVAARPVPTGADLALTVTDGSSGAPADDLLVHDSALVHLVVVTPSGGLRHLHPARTGPGTYRVLVDSTEQGHYAVSAEIARRGGGVQLLRSATGFDLGTGTTAPAPVAGDGPRRIGGTDVVVRTEGLDTAGATTVHARFGTGNDLQPWLGMVGHMIVVGPLRGGQDVGRAAQDAPVWGHVHHMVPTGPGGQPDETVAAYGPDTTFTHHFSLPGRYLVWLQAERHYSVLTVPVELTITGREDAEREEGR